MKKKITQVDYNALMNGKGCRFGKCTGGCDQSCLILEAAYEGRGPEWIEAYLAEINRNNDNGE